jgi:tRNA G10  N-methylase Trm11
VRYGLAAIATLHLVADAGRLPLRDGSVDGVATEPPYAPELLPVVAGSLGELARVVTPGGRLSLFAAEEQAGALVAAGEGLPLSLLHRFRIDRKGTACEALVWARWERP